MAVEITIRLPESQAERLRALAQARGVSLEALVRETLQRALPDASLETSFAEGESPEGLEVRFERTSEGYTRLKLYRSGVEVLPDPWSIVGCGRSGMGDLSTRHDDYFVEAILGQP
ncbi:MAG: BrnA antitoxin family protein [Fimbriimonadales bacterium]|nr:BrnA antitoxin family protein [Fimbriimonadales bacterium]